MKNTQSLMIPPACEDSQMAQFIDRVVEGLQSRHSQRAYKRAIVAFVEFMGQRREPLNKALMNEWKGAMRASGQGDAAINNALSAARFFLREAADNGLLDRAAVDSAVKVSGLVKRGTRAGNWLTREQCERILQAPDQSTALGLRDRAILGVMIGSGLRRSEVAALTVEHFQQRDGRWCIVDIIGKRNKVRTVPIPAFSKALLDLWTSAANIASGPVWRQASWSRDKFVVSDTPLSDKGVARVCRRYGLLIDAPRIAAHDLRRSFAKLAHAGGADLAQIQICLGHDSLETTQKYLGAELNYSDSAADYLGLRVSL